MDCGKAKGGKKGGLMLKTWKRCKSLSSSSSKRVGPEGCFSIYVGPEKERFVMKTEYVNHPLFKILLEEAESEYGYTSHGPLVLPCQVPHFINVLIEMEMEMDHHHLRHQAAAGCNFARPRTSTCTSSHTTSYYHLLIL